MVPEGQCSLHHGHGIEVQSKKRGGGNVELESGILLNVLPDGPCPEISTADCQVSLGDVACTGLSVIWRLSFWVAGFSFTSL